MNVRVFLRTPLHRGRVVAPRKYELDDTVVEVVGEAEHRDGGLDIKVSALYNDKGVAVESPWPHIFLPGSKMDVYVIE